jgi:hypothetical protein
MEKTLYTNKLKYESIIEHNSSNSIVSTSNKENKPSALEPVAKSK